MTYCCYCTFNQTRSKRDPTNSSFWYEFSQDFFVTFLWFAHRVEEIAPKETKTNCCLRLQIAFQIETRFKLHIFFISQRSRRENMIESISMFNYFSCYFREKMCQLLAMDHCEYFYLKKKREKWTNLFRFWDQSIHKMYFLIRCFNVNTY